MSTGAFRAPRACLDCASLCVGALPASAQEPLPGRGAGGRQKRAAAREPDRGRAAPSAISRCRRSVCSAAQHGNQWRLLGGSARRALRMPDRRPLAADRRRAHLLRRQGHKLGDTRPGAGQYPAQQSEILPGAKLPLDVEPLKARRRRTMSVRVRPLRRVTSRSGSRSLQGYVEFYQATVPEDVIETLWQRLMRGGEGFHIGLVAVDDADMPVGLAHLLLHRSTWSNGFYCYLEDLFVDPGAARPRHRPCADRGRLCRSRRPPVHAHLLDDAGDQRHGPRPLRQGGDQVSVCAVSSVDEVSDPPGLTPWCNKTLELRCQTRRV